jgi:4-diphosphocytidyl-2-C-methyl-D-erythritol kinase
VGAGLGGGSSDAGAVLRMMSALERIDGAERLRELALKLGADVPFFLRPAPARIGGIGERITPIKASLKLALVVAVAPFQVSTAEVYQELGSEQWSGRAPEADLAAIESGRISPELLVNDLAAVAMARYPKIAELKAMLERLGAQAAAMTGSGSAVFGIFSEPEEAALAARDLSRRAPEARILTATSVETAW